MSADPDFNTLLLDLHLGQLSDSAAAALRQRIAADPALAAQHETLAGLFENLRRFDAPPAPRDLVARIAARVAAAPAAPRLVRSSAGDEPSESASLGWILRIRSVRDIAAVAAVIVLAVGLGVPSLLSLRERSQRMACSWNLSQVGQGLQAYASAFGDSLPFIGWDRRANTWQPTSDPSLEPRPNRSHVYALLRNGLVQSQAFVCPAGQDVPMPAELVARSNDFLESRNVSYAYQNMAGERPTLREQPGLPIMADDNPLFDNGLPLFEVPRRLGLGDPLRVNSRAHRGKGQNLLTLDGHVRWADSPEAGLAGDNIWTLQNVREYTGREGPQAATDSHLLK